MDKPPYRQVDYRLTDEQKKRLLKWANDIAEELEL